MLQEHNFYKVNVVYGHFILMSFASIFLFCFEFINCNFIKKKNNNNYDNESSWKFSAKLQFFL